MIRKLFEAKASETVTPGPATKVNIKRKKKACPTQAQTLSVQLADPSGTRELRKPSPYEEERMENIRFLRNQEMFRKLFEGYHASPGPSWQCDEALGLT